MGSENHNGLRDALKGKTLKVYFFMLRQNRPLTAREIQRKAGLSSPSLALHHLNKLRRLDLVSTDSDGQFILCSNVKVGVLTFFIGQGILLMPRYLLYLIFFLSMLVSVFIIFGVALTAERFLLYIVLLAASLIFAFETQRVWRARPS